MKHAELLLVRYNTRAKQNLEWIKSKQAFLSEKPNSFKKISAIQARIQSQELFNQEWQTVLDSWNQQVESVVRQIGEYKHEAHPASNQQFEEICKTLEEMKVKSAELIQALEAWLLVMQQLEADAEEYGTMIQQHNALLEESNQVFVDRVSATSVQEAQDKYAMHQQVHDSFNEKQKDLETIATLHGKIEGAGAKPANYTKIAMPALQTKNEKMGTKLAARSEEWKQYIALLELNEKNLNNWNEAANQYFAYVDEKKAAVQQEEQESVDLTVMVQLQAIQTKSADIMKESQEKVEALKLLFAILVKATIDKQAGVQIAEVTGTHKQLDAFLNRKVGALEQKAKQLDSALERYNQRMGTIEEWIEAKKEFLTTVSASSSITAIASGIKALKAVDQEHKKMQLSMNEAKKLCTIIVEAKFVEEDVQSRTDKAEADMTEIQEKAQTTMEALTVTLEQKQKLEKAKTQFTKRSQEMLMTLDGCGNVIEEDAKACNVKDAQEKLQAVQQVTTKLEQLELQPLQELHDQLVQAGGKQSATYTSTLDSIVKKHAEWKQQATEKVALLQQEEQAQHKYQQMIDEFAVEASSYKEWIDSNVNEVKAETAEPVGKESEQKLAELQEKWNAIEEADISERASASIGEIGAMNTRLQRAVAKLMKNKK